MSNFQLSIIGGLALWVLFVMIVLLLLGANRQPDQTPLDAEAAVQASRPMPLDTAYVRGLQTGARNHVRAGSIE